MEQFGLLKNGVKGLGFGCGKEPLVAVMAKHGCNVLATDIEPTDISDDYWGARSISDLYISGICSEDVFQKQVEFMFVDMKQIPETLSADYDFLWSCCALEHLGSLATGIDFILSSTKCLKPGGVAIHTTEMNLTKGDNTLESPGLSLYRRKDIEHLNMQLEKTGCTMLPVNWHSGDLPEDKHIDLPPYKQELHLKLKIEQFDVTSVGLIVVKH